MPILAELYVATRTRNTANADTENLPVLVVKRGSDIVFTKPLFGGDFRTARGAGAVWRFDVREVNLDSTDLNIQLWASGDDAWSPEHVIAWGVSRPRRGRTGDPSCSVPRPRQPGDPGRERGVDQRRHERRRADPLRALGRSRAGRDTRPAADRD